MAKKKRCNYCHKSKSLNQFYKRPLHERHWGDGHIEICKDCACLKQKERRERNPSMMQELTLKKFGLTISDYNIMVEEQNNLCAICNNPEKARTGLGNNQVRRLAVDHCHETMKIRGLLCGNCNGGLGKFQDNIEYLEAAIKYLKDRQ